MLGQKYKDILNLLNRVSDNGSNTLYYSSAHTIGMTPEDFKRSLQHLENEGYLKLNSFKGGTVFTLTERGAHYEDFEQENPSSIVQNFNIGSVSQSAFGNTGDVVVNNGVSFSEIRDFIKSQEIPEIDKERLDIAIDFIENTIENNQPMKRGFLHKFGELFNKYGETFTKIMLAIGTHYFINPQ